MAVLFTSSKFSATDANGAPLNGGKVNTYLAGTLTRAATYTNQGGATPNANPVILDASGRASIWLDPALTYRFIVTNSADVVAPDGDVDNIVASAAGTLTSDLASTINLAKGDGLVGVNNGDTSEVGRTLHYWIKASRRNLCNFLTTAQVDDIQSGTASLDVTTAFTAAIAAASAAGGNRGAYLDLPQGIIPITSAILTGTANRVWVEGQGNATQIRTNSATADIFTLGDGAAECSGFVFSDFDIWASVTKSAGYGFNNRFATDSQWRNVSVGSNDLYSAAGSVNRMFRGWYFDRFDTVSIYGGQCVTSDDGVQARGNIGDTYGAELVLDGNLRFFRNKAAVRIGGCCGGVYLRRSDASLAQNGLVIDTTLQTGGTVATRRNREVFVEGFNADSCTSWGIWQVAESVALLIMEKPWSASNGTSDPTNGTLGGILIEGGTTVIPVVTIENPTLYNNQGSGLITQGGALVSVDGGQVFQNGQATNGAHGVDFGGTMPTRFSISGTDINQNGKAAKGYGINIPAALDNFNISGVSLYSNAQGTINNAAGVGPTKVIADCIGYVSSANGVASGTTDGSGDITVTHGLSVTPTKVFVQIQGVPAVVMHGVHTIGSTTFKVRLWNGAAAGAALTAFGVTALGWQATA